MIDPILISLHLVLLSKVRDELISTGKERIALSEEEQKTAEECDRSDLPEEQRLKRGMQCFLPRLCPAPTSALAKCMKTHKGNLDECVEEGRASMRCWGEFVGRWYS